MELRIYLTYYILGILTILLYTYINTTTEIYEFEKFN